MRTPAKRLSVLIAILAALVGAGILTTPSKGHAQNATFQGRVSLGALVHGLHALPAGAPRTAPGQEAGQAAASPAASSAPKPVELPEGEGKPIATEYCQMCHKLTNLTKAHKNLDDWKDTIHTMIDRGASVPDDKIDALAQYLAKNFGPQAASSSAATQPAAAASPAPSSGTASSASTAANPVVLPDGDGKEIATENCQACHKLTNLTKAHKSLDDWKDTVQTMIDRGANVPPEKVDILVQYLAKNFGPKDASAPAASSSPAN